MSCQGRRVESPRLGRGDTPGWVSARGLSHRIRVARSLLPPLPARFWAQWRRESGSPILNGEPGRPGSEGWEFCGLWRLQTGWGFPLGSGTAYLWVGFQCLWRRAELAKKFHCFPRFISGMSGGCSNSLHFHRPCGGRGASWGQRGSGLEWHCSVYQEHTENREWEWGAGRGTRITLKHYPSVLVTFSLERLEWYYSYLNVQVKPPLLEVRLVWILKLESLGWVFGWGRIKLSQSLSEKKGGGNFILGEGEWSDGILFLKKSSFRASLKRHYRSIPFCVVKIVFN